MVLDSNAYVVARSGNTGAPLCQHKLKANQARYTGCGYDMTPHSVTYTKERLEAILCRRTGCR